MVWGLLEHLFPFWSLGTNMLLLHEEKKVIRKKEQTQTRIKANFSNLILRQCKSLRFDQNTYNSIPFTTEVRLEPSWSTYWIRSGASMSATPSCSLVTRPAPASLSLLYRDCRHEELGDIGARCPRKKGHWFLYFDPEKTLSLSLRTHFSLEFFPTF